MKTTYPLTKWPSIATLKSELHQLLAVFLASRTIAERSIAKEALLVDLMDVRAHEDQLVARLLLSTAISLRVLDDRSGGAVDAWAIGVGKLVKRIPAPATDGIEVSLREACNKIIHAQHVELERTSMAEACEYLSASVCLYGKDLRSNVWYLELDAAEFAQEGLLVLSQLQLSGALKEG
jgi:hypothetical protein